MLRRGAPLGLALVAVLAAVAAHAHAFLERAEPRVGSTLRAAPAEVKLWFTERLEPAFSRVKVVDENGQRVSRADGNVDPANPALLRVSLEPIPAGGYKVIWRVVSVDTHVTEGEFTFRVAPP